MSELKSELLFEARIPLDAPIDVGDTPEGRNMVFIVKGGRFEGPRLRGEVLPGSGGDWSRVRPDGSGALDVRICLKTDDGAVIYASWLGRMVTTPEHFAYALDFAKPDDPAGAESRYYFRTNPLFETGDPRYAWLNHVVAIGKGRTGDGGVIHEVFAIL